MNKDRKILKIVGILAVIVFFIAYAGAIEAGVLPLSGCFNESGKLVEMFTLQKGEEKQLPETNYSLSLVDVKYVDAYLGAISIELHNDSGYVGQVLLSGGGHGAEKKWEKENFKIVIDKILDNQQVRFGLYLI